jgi:EmrB/QacA subfamily drug resistance transporter
MSVRSARGRALPTRPSLEGSLDRDTIVVGIVATIGLIMAVLDTTIVNVALDTLSRELHAPLDTIQWISTGYLLALAIVTPLSGWVTERFGSKRTWITCLALFAIGSSLCALATSASELIAFRILQGLGGGMLMPVGFTLVAQSAGPRRVGRAFALIGVPILLGPILGPVIGGVIIDQASWRWIFLVNVPIAVVAIGLAAALLDGRNGRADAGPLDWRGAALLCPGLAGIVFGLSEIERQGGLTHPIAFGPVLGGFVLIGVFAWNATRTPRPLIDVALFRSRGFRAAAGITFVLGGALFGTLLVLPLYYQIDRGVSALDAGLLLAPQGVGAAIALPISGRLTDRLGGGRVVLVGCTILVLATIPFALLGSHTSYVLISGVLFIRGLGLGASIQPSTAAAYSLLSPAQVPRATAALNALRQIGGSIGTTVLAVVLQHEQTRVALSPAFRHTFVWGVALAALALLPCVALVRAERGARLTVA